MKAIDMTMAERVSQHSDARRAAAIADAKLVELFPMVNAHAAMVKQKQSQEDDEQTYMPKWWHYPLVMLGFLALVYFEPFVEMLFS